MNFEWLQGIPTLWGTVLHTLAYVALVVWVLRRSPGEVYRDAPDRSRWRDLRLWIVPLALGQVVLYWVF